MPTDYRPPSASVEHLVARANLLRRVRVFFEQLDVLEVDTPLLAPCGVSDPHVLNLRVMGHRPGGSSLGFLQTSPEYAMKRLLSAGLPSIYQICKAFRDDESGNRHNTEFTLLEWYRLDYDHQRLMGEVDTFFQQVGGFGPANIVSYTSLFESHLGIDPISVSDEDLSTLVYRTINIDSAIDDRDAQLQLLFSHCIEPHLGHEAPCLVYDFPVSQAALARQSEVDPLLAHRFEAYINGIELANGFFELDDAVIQRQRFRADNDKRLSLGLPAMALDEPFLSALHRHFPRCAGVALGIDRLLMVLLGVDDIAKVMAFDSQTI